MKSLFLFFLFPIIAVSCFPDSKNSSDNPFIQIEGRRFFLKDNARNDVENFIGKPDNIKYFEQGFEEFFWETFTVCSYDGGTLSFHYDKNDYLIRITANSHYKNEIIIPDGLFSELKFEDIYNMLENKFDKYVSEMFIAYSEKNSSGNEIMYSYWFDENAKLKWYDVYYTKSWY